MTTKYNISTTILMKLSNIFYPNYAVTIENDKFICKTADPFNFVAYLKSFFSLHFLLYAVIFMAASYATIVLMVADYSFFIPMGITTLVIHSHAWYKERRPIIKPWKKIKKVYIKDNNMTVIYNFLLMRYVRFSDEAARTEVLNQLQKHIPEKISIIK